MLRLGNITYSNCYPIHAPIVEAGSRPAWLSIRDGTPGELNALLASNELDVAPCSSIEIARRGDDYLGLSGLCIGSYGPVQSIIVVSKLPLPELDGEPVALPGASATSRSLLRILLMLRFGVEPRWIEFRQENRDPIEHGGAAAALFIGDVALRRPRRTGLWSFDLGALWTEWTGLPFVYALWQVREARASDSELTRLHRQLLAARDAVPESLADLALVAGPRFHLPPGRLRHYWAGIRYSLDARMLDGLARFFELAAELGDAPHEARPRWID